MLTVYVDMRILIEKILKRSICYRKVLILLKHGNIWLPLTVKKNTISNHFTMYIL